MLFTYSLNIDGATEKEFQLIISLKSIYAKWFGFHEQKYIFEHYRWIKKMYYISLLMFYKYTIMIIQSLSIYTSMKHSLLLLKTFSACAQLFRHPVWHWNKSIYTSLLIKRLSIINPSLACLGLLLLFLIISN